MSYGMMTLADSPMLEYHRAPDSVTVHHRFIHIARERRARLGSRPLIKTHFQPAARALPQTLQTPF